jgi:hypothetical protein
VKSPAGADLVIPALAAAFAVYFFFSIADLAWEAKANGVVIGTVLLLLIAAQVVRTLLAVSRGEADLGLEPLIAPRAVLTKRLGVLVVTIAFIALLPWLGLTLALWLGLLAALWLMGVRSRTALIAVPAGVATAAYLLFIALLHSDIPHGPIERLFS